MTSFLFFHKLLFCIHITIVFNVVRAFCKHLFDIPILMFISVHCRCKIFDIPRTELEPDWVSLLPCCHPSKGHIFYFDRILVTVVSLRLWLLTWPSIPAISIFYQNWPQSVPSANDNELTFLLLKASHFPSSITCRTNFVNSAAGLRLHFKTFRYVRNQTNFSNKSPQNVLETFSSCNKNSSKILSHFNLIDPLSPTLGVFNSNEFFNYISDTESFSSFRHCLI